MSYQALYRQWRPAHFDDFVGQESVIATLRNQVQSGRIAHAYLFCGSRGTGKTSAAKVLARAVNCEHPDRGEPCGQCDTCRALLADNNLDIVEIDAASNNGVDEIRDLREKVKYPPQSGKFRVYIIDEVHMLSAGAFNALLKTLEEPPAHVVFILATTEPQKLPATILSRCQRFDFSRIPVKQIIGRLAQAAEGAGATASPAALERIARAAEGGMRDALSILDMCLSYADGTLQEDVVLQVLGASDRGFLFRFSGALLSGDAAACLSMVDELMQRGREPQVFARDLSGHLRALMLAQTCGDGLCELLDITSEDAAQYRAQVKDCSRTRLLRMLDVFLACETDMKWASQPRIALEVAVVRACEPEDALTLSALVERVDLLEKKLAAGAFTAASSVPSAQQAQPAAQTQSPQQTQSAPKTAPVPKAPASAQPAEPASPGNTPPAGVRPPDDVWEAMTLDVKRNSPMIFGSLIMGRYAGYKDGAYVLSFPKNPAVAIYMNLLARDEKRAVIEQALQKAGGVPARLKIVQEGDPAATHDEKADAQKRLNHVFDVFGRENVQVTDE
ncbi:DNA polymerase III subunit gamma/tau [Beduinella massiliensis]|uniref:DNA polymerase III subunit gamma/tau n=1 Tax=Beduinella massiliensis TaxID=1852363 RepID=UPI000C81E714